MPHSYKNLYPKIYDFQNLLTAFYRARTGKRNRKDVAAFEFNLEANLIDLEEELKNKTYQPGRYKNFYVNDQKRRLITAAPFKDRVVHHALLQIIEPIFERMFIFDSYGCRVGKGQHRASDRFQHYARNNKYVLRCDIQKFYPSVDHEILLAIINRWIKDSAVIELIENILDSGKDILKEEYMLNWFLKDNLFTPIERKRGLPIGNLTSQFLGNVYLNQFDHYVKENLSCPFYLRYMDDFAIFDDSKRKLWMYKDKLVEFFDKLRLVLNPKKQYVFPVEIGVDFLGYRIFPAHRLVRKTTIYRYSRKLKQLAQNFREKKTQLATLKASLFAWFGHIKHANSYNLRKMVLKRAGLLF